MRVEETKYSIAEIAHWVRTRDLIVNATYQRGPSLWPAAAKSYFIDTILREFPFPKIYFHEMLDREQKKPKREIVDGQQRVGVIVDFLEDRIELGANAGEFKGLKFSGLSLEQQESFYGYTVAVDVIRNADRASILQMFRRMNAYTLPLNAAEKRHSSYFGEFKNWVNNTLDEFGNLFVEWNVLTSRQIVRMADAELVTDLALAVEEGIVSTSPKKLSDMYSKNDATFTSYAEMNERVNGTLAFVRSELSFIQGTFLTKTHMFHSLVCALIQNRFGLPGGAQNTGLTPSGKYMGDFEIAKTSLLALALAYEEKDPTRFPEFVEAASEGGNRATQRAVRIDWLASALRGHVR